MEKPDTNTSAEGRSCRRSEAYKQIYLSLTYSIIFVLGPPPNGAVLWLSWRQAKRWSCATIYLANLMVADPLCLSTPPFLIVAHSLRDAGPFAGLLCRLVRFLFYASLHRSVLLLACISGRRFLAVSRPLRPLRFRTRRHAPRGATAAWALVAIQLLPALAFSHTDGVDGQVICHDTASADRFDQLFVHGVVLALSGFALPALVILGCYALTVRSLAAPAEALRRAGGAARAKSMRTILLVSGLFALCFVPFHVSRCLCLTPRFLSSDDCQLLTAVSLAYKIWRPLVSLSSCLNPVLYFLAGGSRVRLFQGLGHKVAEPPAGAEGQRPPGGQVWVLPRGSSGVELQDVDSDLSEQSHELLGERLPLGLLVGS